MSDNTTDTPETNVDGVEPSMEDILASIRRIIADDDQVNSEFLDNTPRETVTEVAAVAEIPAPEDVVSQTKTAESHFGAPLDTLDLNAEDIAENEVVLEALGEVDEPLVMTSMETAEEAEVSDLEGLDDLDLIMSEEILPDEGVADNPIAAKDKDSPRLTGLAGLAAAGLGAAAAAGSGVAKAIRSDHQSLEPADKDGAEEDVLDDIASLGPRANAGAEDFDLVLDDLTGNDESQADDLDSFLEIPAEPSEQEPLDDLDRLLNNMLGDSSPAEPEPEDEFVVDPAADLIADTADAHEDDDVHDLLSDLMEGDNDEIGEGSAVELQDNIETSGEAQSDPDLDLVKSLMADLTDDPYPETAASEEAEVTAQAPQASEDEAPEDNVIDEILQLSMEDEENLRQGEVSDMNIADIVAPLAQDDVPAETTSEQDNAPFFIDINADLPKPEPAKSSLAEIANSAKAEAERIKNQGFSTGQFAAGAGVAVAAAGPITALVNRNSATEAQAAPAKESEAAQSVDQTVAAETSEETSKDEVQAPKTKSTKPKDTNAAAQDRPISKKTKESPPKETADMPKASAKDTIVDNATEDATASAFASLNKVIDEKTTMADRGDRIGDLVQEALRPMLKEWLDKNLKGIVERAVTKEVKRISSGK